MLPFIPHNADTFMTICKLKENLLLNGVCVLVLVYDYVSKHPSRLIFISTQMFYGNGLEKGQIGITQAAVSV